MTLCRLIAPQWLMDKEPRRRKVLEGLFSDQQLKEYNDEGYNVYYLPNGPSDYQAGITVDGSQIDVFNFIFVDMDLKELRYASKEIFLETVGDTGIEPSKVVDSGNGVHVYWKVTNLDAMSYLRLSRRLMRLLRTDEAVGQIFQLMRLPGYDNTKHLTLHLPCTLEYESDITYTPEQLDRLLPPITAEDEAYCQIHHDKTYNLNQTDITISEEMPTKWGKLLRDSHEAKELWSGDSDDRSKSDYRLGHLMFAAAFTKEEAMTVLANSVKASQRAPKHRISYAENIVNKIWTYELAEDKSSLDLSSSVKDILQKSGSTLKGTPFRCHKRIDNTEHGFRLGQVLGLVGGSGVGKTAFAMNLFMWFAQENPDYHHFFVPLEQPANEIADRWKTMCQGDTSLHDKVHVLSNYDDEGNFRHLSFDEIKSYINKFQQQTGNKVGCIVIDHIGALKKKGAKSGENQDLMDICHSMKAFAVQTNTFLVMQSQSSREKAGIGDIELNKDAAYGTMFFEAYCDYLLTIWLPLKRCHHEQSCPTVTAFKYCKIRHKKARRDVIKEDVPYFMAFDSETELMKDMTQDQKTSFDFFIKQATNKRKVDRKTDIAEYKSVPYKEGEIHATTTTSNHRLSSRH